MTGSRHIEGDWYSGQVPENVVIDETACVETSYSFYLFCGEKPEAVRIGRGASTFLGTMFDVGPEGRVTLGDYALVHGAWIISDAEVAIGPHALISWNVIIMDTYRVPADPGGRRRELLRTPLHPDRRPRADVPARPVRIGPNVWIGFGSCVLPGVTIGEGAVVGAASVVASDVEAYTVVAGNPARLIRRLEGGGS